MSEGKDVSKSSRVVQGQDSAGWMVGESRSYLLHRVPTQVPVTSRLDMWSGSGHHQTCSLDCFLL